MEPWDGRASLTPRSLRQAKIKKSVLKNVYDTIEGKQKRVSAELACLSKQNGCYVLTQEMSKAKIVDVHASSLYGAGCVQA